MRCEREKRKDNVRTLPGAVKRTSCTRCLLCTVTAEVTWLSLPWTDVGDSRETPGNRSLLQVSHIKKAVSPGFYAIRRQVYSVSCYITEPNQFYFQVLYNGAFL